MMEGSTGSLGDGKRPRRAMIIAGLILGLGTLDASARFVPPQGAGQKVLAKESRHGAVASESSVCSSIGLDLLKMGGNAADAMVGTTLCVGTIGMYHSGIGGGGFMLVRSASGAYESVDFRETAPAAAHQDMYAGNANASIWGGLAVGVPGEIMGLEYLHRKYGALPWEAVVRPAVHVARTGFPVTEDLIRYMSVAKMMPTGGDFLEKDPNWAVDFAPSGKLVQLGDIMTRKRYADTLEIIGKHGAKVFYKGPIAEAMVDAIQASNGSMTLQDLASYKVVSRPAISISYRSYTLHSTGAPSSGAVALSAFKTIEGYTMNDPALRNLSTHRLDEAIRFAYAAHAELGDPDFVDDLDVEAFERHLLRGSTAKRVRERISDERTREVAYYNPKGLLAKESHGTSHIVTADSSGMSVSLTTTINLVFGSAIMEPMTGIILNNEMSDFSIPSLSNPFGFVPSAHNFIAPRKRPLSSITPIIVEHASNSSLYCVLGAAGGSRIITATIQSLWHVLDHGMGIKEALVEKRMHDQLIPDEVAFEEGYDRGVVMDMAGKGHRWGWVGPMSSVQGLRVVGVGEDGGLVFEAAGEPRQSASGGLVF